VVELNNFFEYSISTGKGEEFINITHLVEKAIRDSDIQNGIAVVFCPHTTAGVTINENADPDVVHDIIKALDRAFPVNGDYRHVEGNSHAHIKASCMGASCYVIISNGRPVLGTWQGVYFCEFDGPRRRKVYISCIGAI
jgi:secondary thiamine-phosphate synthase enzyme